MGVDSDETAPFEGNKDECYWRKEVDTKTCKTDGNLLYRRGRQGDLVHPKQFCPATFFLGVM